MCERCKFQAQRGAWFAFDEVLSWINSQDVQMINKKDLYKAVMDMRPSAMAALENLNATG
jgi:hypothetical protein